MDTHAESPYAGVASDLDAALALFVAGAYDKAWEAVESLHGRCHGSPKWQSRAALLGAKIGWNSKRPEGGLRWADVAVDLASRLGDRALIAEAWALKGACHALQPAPTLAVQCLDRALRELTLELPPDARRTVLTAIGLSHQYLGLSAPATSALRRALEIARQHEADVMRLRCAINFAYALVESLDTAVEQEPALATELRAEAKTLIAAIDRELPPQADDQLFYGTRDATARLALACDDPADAEARLRACLERGTERRPIHLLSWYIDLAHACSLLGRSDEARAWAVQARALLDEGGEVPTNHVEYRRMARLAAVEGDAAGVLQWMRRFHARLAVRQQAMLDARAAELHALDTQQRLHVELDELRRRDAGLRLEFQALERLAATDALTGVCNRRGLESAYGRLAPDSVCLMLIDLDHFKAINDRFGHVFGDEVLRRFALCIGHICREQDLLARYGGEEFVVLLAARDDAGAMQAAERIRQGVERHAWGDLEPGLRVTLSAGLVRAGVGESIGAVIQRADAALYAAKTTGRNRVVADLVRHGAAAAS